MEGPDASDATKHGKCINVPTMIFDRHKGQQFCFLHNNPLILELKVANALMRQIVINTGSSTDIITWDCLKRLRHPRREIIHFVHPILGIGGQEENPTGVIRLPL